MRILITAGPTYEPIDAVRFIGNRSSGRMGMAIAGAAVSAGHEVTLILGPVSFSAPTGAKRIDVETTTEMHRAVMSDFPQHDLLIMAAAVADYRPAKQFTHKLPRSGGFSLELVPTPDILAAVGQTKRPDQRTVGFSLEVAGNLQRSREKLAAKKLDLIVYNPTMTLNATDVSAALLYPDGREEHPGDMTKLDFGRLLVARATSLFTAKAR